MVATFNKEIFTYEYILILFFIIGDLKNFPITLYMENVTLFDLFSRFRNSNSYLTGTKNDIT